MQVSYLQMKLPGQISSPHMTPPVVVPEVSPVVEVVDVEVVGASVVDDEPEVDVEVPEVPVMPPVVSGEVVLEEPPVVDVDEDDDEPASVSDAVPMLSSPQPMIASEVVRMVREKVREASDEVSIKVLRSQFIAICEVRCTRRLGPPGRLDQGPPVSATDQI